MPDNVLILLKGFNGGIFFRQRFFIVKIMNAIVAYTADEYAFLEFAPGKTLPGFFPAVEFSGDQVVTGQKAGLSAQLTFLCVGFLEVHPENFDSSQLQNRF